MGRPATGAIPNPATAANKPLESTTKALFVQTAAPTGWTKDTDQDDKALRIVSGTPSAGGATAFSSVFGSSKDTGDHAGTTPSHAHTESPSLTVGSGGGSGNAAGGTQGDTEVTITAGGAGGVHKHSLSLDLNFMDVIKATKD